MAYRGIVFSTNETLKIGLVIGNFNIIVKLEIDYFFIQDILN
jgi:hypothetical protein